MAFRDGLTDWSRLSSAVATTAADAGAAAAWGQKALLEEK